MKIRLQKLGSDVVEVIERIGRYADKRGIRAYVVGGIVRDAVLCRKNKDIDVVLEGDAIAFARDFAREYSLTVVGYPRFRTASLSGCDGVHIDCVTARSERYPHPGALPVVVPAGLDQDLFRRDFTLNGLAVSINAETFGQAMDLYGGMADLRRGVIRVFHDRSFLDDPTRILRAVRFEQRFGFRFSDRTRRLLCSAIDRKAWRTVSAPRYFKEFARGFGEENPGKYLTRLAYLGGVDFLGDGYAVPRGLLRRLDSYVSGSRFQKVFKDVDRTLLYLCALFYLENQKRVLELAGQFQWPRTWKKAVLDIFPILNEWDQLRLSRDKESFRRFFESCDIQELVFLRVAVLGRVAGELCDAECKRRSRD